MRDAHPPPPGNTLDLDDQLGASVEAAVLAREEPFGTRRRPRDHEVALEGRIVHDEAELPRR